MGISQKPYKELRKVMDEYGFRLLGISRTHQERWAGLRWNEDRPLKVSVTLPPHASASLIRQIREAAGEMTVDRAKKRDAQAIKERQASARERARIEEEVRAKRRHELVARRANRDEPEQPSTVNGSLSGYVRGDGIKFDPMRERLKGHDLEVTSELRRELAELAELEQEYGPDAVREARAQIEAKLLLPGA
ncbi:hypothetical protein IT072_13940 [Leifsonia sp. ZF2019]|uniref:hypothetical protein n=1 Tax=Leifsonia sp. ZF2019 TaxID=2781978 RepID=UPI001CBBE53A|nr:hypothetical protein [Leifsonia sp. ZF2019]UAJ78359.1 hypothetical protein IT072_13940 [Leifsonia sp. ZF2019]